MGADASRDTPVLPTVHGLLVCRNAEAGPGGQVDLREVLEIVALDAIPGDAGPLAFVAFVRGLPPGPARLAFVVRAAGAPTQVLARLPFSMEVPAGLADRQLAVQVRLPTITVKRGGWFEVALEWDGRTLATNRFAIGARANVPPKAAASAE